MPDQEQGSVLSSSRIVHLSHVGVSSPFLPTRRHAQPHRRELNSLADSIKTRIFQSTYVETNNPRDSLVYKPVVHVPRAHTLRRTCSAGFGRRSGRFETLHVVGRCCTRAHTYRRFVRSDLTLAMIAEMVMPASSSPVTGLMDSAEEAKAMKKKSIFSYKLPTAKASRSLRIGVRHMISCLASDFRISVAASLL